jgi:hypothetical protein
MNTNNIEEVEIFSPRTQIVGIVRFLTKLPVFLKNSKIVSTVNHIRVEKEKAAVGEVKAHFFMFER